MAGMGPAPKPAGQRARRNATVGMTQLPWDGRKGRAPAWPLIDDIDLQVDRDMAKKFADEAEAALEFDAEIGEMTKAQRKKAEAEYDRLRRRHLVLDAKVKQQRKHELLLWRDLWKTPQATQWEKLSWTRDVAQYARHKVRAELGSLDDAKEARQMADRIGLTPLSLLRLRWEIASKPETTTGRGRTDVAGRTSSRARRGPLTAVPDLPAE